MSIFLIVYANMFDFINSGFLDIYEQKQHRERHHETRLEKLVWTNKIEISFMEQKVEFRQFNISGPLNTDSAPGAGLPPAGQSFQKKHVP